MSNTPRALLQASLSHYVAKKDKALSELDIYLNRPVGVGEHAKITDEVIALFKQLDEAQSVIELISGIMKENAKTPGELMTEIKNITDNLEEKK